MAELIPNDDVALDETLLAHVVAPKMLEIRLCRRKRPYDRRSTPGAGGLFRIVAKGKTRTEHVIDAGDRESWQRAAVAPDAAAALGLETAERGGVGTEVPCLDGTIQGGEGEVRNHDELVKECAAVGLGPLHIHLAHRLPGRRESDAHVPARGTRRRLNSDGRTTDQIQGDDFDRAVRCGFRSIQGHCPRALDDGVHIAGVETIERLHRPPAPSDNAIEWLRLALSGETFPAHQPRSISRSFDISDPLNGHACTGHSQESDNLQSVTIPLTVQSEMASDYSNRWMPRCLPRSD